MSDRRCHAAAEPALTGPSLLPRASADCRTGGKAPARPRRTALLALAGALWLAGCATTTQEPPLPVAQPGIAGQWPGTGPAGSPVVADLGWRDFFVDPALTDLIAAALTNNRDLRVAALNVERARAVLGGQEAERNPVVAATGSLTRGRSVAMTTLYSAAVGITAWELDLFGRVRSLTDASARQLLAQEQARRSVQVSLVADLATAWLTLAADQEAVRLGQATLAALETALTLTERRHALGAASALDVSQARTMVESARADVARLNGLVAADRNALTLLAGAPLEARWLPSGAQWLQSSVTSVAPLPAQLPSEVLLYRPDVAQAEFLLRATNASIGAARAAYFPTISLTANVGTASRDLTDLFQSGTGSWSFIPQIRLPIFQGARLDANLGITTADRDIALARYEKAIQGGFREVADALAAGAAIAARKSALTGVLAAAQQTHDLAAVRYRAGRDSYLVLLDAQRTLYAAQQNLVSIQLAEQVNRVTLYKVLGGGWRERRPG